MMRRTGAGWTAVPLALTVLLATAPAVAEDGVIEINQAKALVGGVTPDDTPGFPVTISEPGSYRLTSDLTMKEADLDCLYILPGDVTIDLNGFTIRGPGGGSGNGIAAGNPNIRITNGTIIGFGGNGIETAEYAYVEKVRAINNGQDGIFVNGFGSVVVDCSARGNGNDGIRVGDHAVVSGCTTFDNGGNGIETGHGVVVRQNSVTANHSTGINTYNGCAVIDNAVRLNLTWGLGLTSNTGYSGNVINGNPSGTAASGVVMGTNLCNASTTCP